MSHIMDDTTAAQLIIDTLIEGLGADDRQLNVKCRRALLVFGNHALRHLRERANDLPMQPSHHQRIFNAIDAIDASPSPPKTNVGQLVAHALFDCLRVANPVVNEMASTSIRYQ